MSTSSVCSVLSAVSGALHFLGVASFAVLWLHVICFNCCRAIFEKEVTGMLQKRNMLENIPPELCCPLCRGVLKEAVLTSKCCFKSYCDKCTADLPSMS